MGVARKPQSPCRDCSDRQVGCHSDCEKYILWKTDHDKVSEAIRADKRRVYDADAFLTGQHQKYKQAMHRVSKKGGYKG